jgi:acetyltransferase-like isoleucine patch superfamily enzyme
MRNIQIILLEKFKNYIRQLKQSAPGLYYFISVLRFRRHYRFNTCFIRGKGNNVKKKNAILNGVKMDIIGNLNCIEIDKWAVLDQVTFQIRGNANKVVLGSECVISNSIIWIEDDGCEVRIGRQTTIGGVHLAATEDYSKVIIGDDCMLAYGIDIRTGDSHGIYDKAGRRINSAKDIVIDRHVWIATNAAILKGAVIGAGSIVGTGAIVTQGIYPSSCILAGNPATVVREGIQWTRLRSDSFDAA